MVGTEGLHALTALLSGPALALIAVPLVSIRPRRAYVVSLAAFLVLWGALITLGNLSRIAYAEGHLVVAERSILGFLALQTVLYVPLVHFSSVYPVRHGLIARRTWAALLLLVPAIVGVAFLYHDISWFYRGFASGAGLGANWGPLFPAFVVLFAAALYVTLWSLSRHGTSSTHGHTRRRTHLVLVALSLYTAFWAAELATVSVGRILLVGTTPVEIVYLVVALVGLGLLLRHLITPPAADGQKARRHARLAITIPAVFGIVSGTTALHPAVPWFETLGLWRLGAAVLLTLALLRYEESRTARRALMATLGFTGLLLGLILAVYAQQAIESVVGSMAVAVTLTQAVLMAAIFAVLLGNPSTLRWLATRLGTAVPDLDAHRLDVYEAALAHAQTETDSTRSMQRLEALRERLAISPTEHESLSRIVAAHSVQVHRAPTTGTLIAGRYRLGAHLGQGTNGAAYEADDLVLGRRVVVKVLNGTDRIDLDAFRNESRLAASAEHQNVLRVYDSGVHGTTPFLVTEQADGGTLEALIQERGALPETEALALIDGILQGLAHLHERGVVHGDLSPANILIGRDGRPRIADFGLALTLDPNTTQTGLDAPRAAGTPATMSPEQTTGLAPRPKSDLYSAGAILYRLLTGHHYADFEGKDAFGLRHLVLHAEPAPLPDAVSKKTRDLVRRALAKDPQKRPATAEAMRQALGLD